MHRPIKYAPARARAVMHTPLYLHDPEGHRAKGGAGTWATDGWVALWRRSEDTRSCITASDVSARA